MALQTSGITEEQVIIAFHSFLQAALAQAHAEKLLDESILTSAEADIQIQGPAICLFLAALRSQGSPASISTTQLKLDQNNCPASFTNWFKLWAQAVPLIKSLSIDQQYDLARMICEQEPVSQPIRIELPLLALNLRKIALEISQRRTFQERFNEDLNFALRHGARSSTDPVAGTTQGRPSAQYSPPPAYDESEQARLKISKPEKPRQSVPNSLATAFTHSTLPRPTRSSTPDLSLAQAGALSIIRETVYASLTDVLYSTPSILNTLQSKTVTDGQLSRAYFAALTLAILDVTLNRADPVAETVQVVQLSAVQPTTLTLESCPIPFRPLMTQLIQIAKICQNISQDDDTMAMRAALSDTPNINTSKLTKIEKLRLELEFGVSNHDEEEEPDEDVWTASNWINTLALKISQISSFRDREKALFHLLVPSLAERVRQT